MNLTALKLRLRNKPPALVLPNVVLFLLLIFLKWKIALPFGSLLFLLGGILGIYLLDIAEEFFELNPSPFRTAIFSVGLFIVGIYVMSSTREYIAQGLVLSLNLTLLMFAVSEWRIHQNLDSWFSTIISGVGRETQRVGIVFFGIGFFVLCTMFLLM